MANISGRAPLITVVGATGTGKSELAVNIARKYNGEIINGDAMQLYEGLPVITNKMPEEEREGVPHHLLGCIGLKEETWTVGNFVTNALAKISEIRERGKLPILVGGTHYYTQSLLFNDALANKPREEEKELEQKGERSEILDASTEVILEKLREVDPVMANRWHPNDRRKIQRSLEIWLQTGRRASDIYEEQRKRREGASQEETHAEDANQLRMRSLILWVGADHELLSKRLDSRVDKMISQGLLDEVNTLSDFHESWTDEGHSIDMTRGIWVAIGYKEFLDHQAALRKGDSSPAEISKLLAQAIDSTKAHTRQYAKSQIRWIRIKLNHAVEAAGAKSNFFMLDGSNLSTWEQDVSEVGLQLVDSFLKEEQLPDPSTLSPLAAEMLTAKRHDTGARVDLWERHHCDPCNMTAVTESDWTSHVNSRKHKKAVYNSRRRALVASAEETTADTAVQESGEPPKSD